jgi:hypothetical protein
MSTRQGFAFGTIVFGAFVAIGISQFGNGQPSGSAPFVRIVAGANADIDQTAERLTATSTIAQAVTIKAGATNTGTIYIGHSAVEAATPTGFGIVASGPYSIAGPIDLSEIWLDATADDQAVTYTYTQAR